MRYLTREDKSGQWWVFAVGSADGYPVPDAKAADTLAARATFDPHYVDRLLAMGMPTETEWVDS